MIWTIKVRAIGVRPLVKRSDVRSDFVVAQFRERGRLKTGC